MARINWKYWISCDPASNQRGILVLLGDTETVFVRMIQGMGVFVIERIPKVVRAMLAWLRSSCLLAAHIAVRLVRVTAVVVAWLAIVIGPLAVYPSVITCLSTAFALAGSLWGLRRQFKERTRLAGSGMPSRVVACQGTKVLVEDEVCHVEELR